MKKFIAVLAITALLACTLPLQPNLNFNVDVPPLPAVFADLEGQWVLSGEDGDQSCLVIQESRVSIVDLTCSSDGRGAVARIVSSPVIARAGNSITLTVTFNPHSLDDSQQKLTFVGGLQIDGSFVGNRRDEMLNSKSAPVSTAAVLSRH